MSTTTKTKDIEKTDRTAGNAAEPTPAPPSYTFPDGVTVTGPWENPVQHGESHIRTFDGAAPGSQWALHIDGKGVPKHHTKLQKPKPLAATPEEAAQNATEARQEAAKTELSEWQKRVRARQVEDNAEKPPYAVEGTEGMTWFIDQPASTAVMAVQSILASRIMGEGGESNTEQVAISLMSAGFAFLFVVQGKDNPTPLFETFDEAVEFVDGRDFPIDAYRVVNAITARYTDFLAEFFPNG